MQNLIDEQLKIVLNTHAHEKLVSLPGILLDDAGLR